jgi:hypothetical protein
MIVPTGQYVPALQTEQVVLLTVPYVFTEQRETPARYKQQKRKAHADEKIKIK